MISSTLSRTGISKKLKIGKNIGIISYNETPLKEICSNGITVISTDHAKMGETAARLILENRKEKIKNPFTLIIRKSLYNNKFTAMSKARCHTF